MAGSSEVVLGQARQHPRNAPFRLRLDHAAGYFKICANACKRVASAGLFAAVALDSSDAAMPFNFATFFPLMCDASAP